MEQNVRLHITDMTCVNCEHKIEQALNNAAGVIRAVVSYERGIADVIYDAQRTEAAQISAVVTALDYTVRDAQDAKESRLGVVDAVSLIVMIAALYITLQTLGVLTYLAPGQLADSSMGYGMLFVIGLITSVHCIAMCGGINLSQTIPKRTDGENPQDMARRDGISFLLPAVLYNLGRVGGYTAVGCVLGLIGFFLGGGADVGLPVLLQGIVKILAGLFMAVMGINLLGLFPSMRRFGLRLPRGVARFIYGKRMGARTPFLIGIINALMPCGPMQAMWLVALAAGNPLSGALSMFAFALGTVPLMLGLGAVVSALGKRFTAAVMRVGAVLVVVLGLAMLSQGGALTGLFGQIVPKASGAQQSVAVLTDGVQIVDSRLSSGSYPDITVQAGVPVRWVIHAPESSINGCNYRLLIQDYGIEHTFTAGDNIIEFTPEQTGTVHYSCWMGMIQGNIHITESL